ncbi:MAG: prepilin peptidase [Eubacterium sp.]|nr:prepilin peptidase [Eubacterium sp.]
MEAFIYVIVGVILLVLSVWDVRKKTVPVIPVILCVVLVMVYRVFLGEISQTLGGIGIGGLILMVSFLSGGAVGGGDALVFGMTGALLGISGNVELLLLSLILSGIVSLFFVVIKKKGRKYRIPYVPFIGIAYGFIAAVRIYEGIGK